MNFRWVQWEQQAVNTGCLNYETWFSYIVEYIEPQSHWKHGGTKRIILLNFRWVQWEQQAVNTGCLNYETWFSYIVDLNTKVTGAAG